MFLKFKRTIFRNNFAERERTTGTISDNFTFASSYSLRVYLRVHRHRQARLLVVHVSLKIISVCSLPQVTIYKSTPASRQLCNNIIGESTTARTTAIVSLASFATSVIVVAPPMPSMSVVMMIIVMVTMTSLGALLLIIIIISECVRANSQISRVTLTFTVIFTFHASVRLEH